MKLFVRVLSLSLLTFILCFGLSFAQNTGSTTTIATSGTSISAQLEASRNIALGNLDSAVTQFRAQHFSGSQSIQNNAHYQSLVCLGVFDQQNPHSGFDQAATTLRNQLIQEYLDLDSKIRALGYGLPIDQVKLQSDIANFTAAYAMRVTQLIANYNTQIQQIQADVIAYGAANTQLLASINTKLSQLNTIQSQYTTLEDMIFQFNNTLLVQEGNMLDSISEQKRQAIAALDEKLTTLIRQQVAISSHIVGLETVLQNRKRDITRLYGLDFDDAMTNVVGNWYSRSAHDELKEQMQTIRNTFYQGDAVRCQNILTAGMDVDGYATVVLNNINTMKNRLTTGIATLQASGASEQLKQGVFTTFQGLYTTRIQQEIANMRTFATDQVAVLVDKAAKQTEQRQQIQERKQQYDSSRDEAIKNDIIFQAKNLHEAASTMQLKKDLESLLLELGVDLTPTTKNIHGETVQTDNPFFPVVMKMASKYTSNVFAPLMQVAISVLQERATNQTAAQRVLLDQIIQAIQLYIGQ